MCSGVSVCVSVSLLWGVFQTSVAVIGNVLELELVALMELIHRNRACCVVAQPVRHLLPVFSSFFPPQSHIWFLKDDLSQKLIHILTIYYSQ